MKTIEIDFNNPIFGRLCLFNVENICAVLVAQGLVKVAPFGSGKLVVEIGKQLSNYVARRSCWQQFNTHDGNADQLVFHRSHYCLATLENRFTLRDLLNEYGVLLESGE